MGTIQSTFRPAPMSHLAGVGGPEAVAWSIFSEAVLQLAEPLLMKTLLFENCAALLATMYIYILHSTTLLFVASFWNLFGILRIPIIET